MSTVVPIQNKQVYDKIRAMSNQYRFRILELTENKTMNISEISKELKLSYTKCSDYIHLLENEDLILKIKEGKEVFIKSKIKIQKERINFI
jgi:predicted transcriptional regulator